MLLKQNRLRKDKDIKKVLSKGRAFFNPFFTLKYLKTAILSRFTVVVSTKVSKKAVKRNRLKRLVREFIRGLIDQIPFGDYTLIIKPEVNKIKEKELINKLQELILKVKQ